MAKRLIPFNICQWFFQPGQRSICFTQNCGHLLRQPENDVNSACTRSYKYILRWRNTNWNGCLIDIPTTPVDSASSFQSATIVSNRPWGFAVEIGSAFTVIGS
jgi:hypothetical protein